MDDDVVDTREIGGVEYRVRLVHDEDCESPRGLCDAGRIVARSSRYSWPVEDGDHIDANSIADAVEGYPFPVVARWLRVFHGATVALPLYSRGPEDRPSAGDISDDAYAGNYIGVTFDQQSTRDAAGMTPECVAAALRGDVDEYSSWAVGEVYGYVIEHRAAEPHPECRAVHAAGQWEEAESCWGFIGLDYAEEEARRALREFDDGKSSETDSGRGTHAAAGAGDVLSALYAVAGDGEAAMLDELAERAGLVWACAGCGWRNPSDASACEGCGARSASE